MYNKDEDIKIAGPYPSREKANIFEEKTEEISNEIALQTENGNLRKAQELGRRLAFNTYNLENWFTEENFDDANKDEIKTLRVFSIICGLKEFSPNETTQKTATSTFTSALRDLDYSYYEKINTSGSYSMYLLTLRRFKDNITEKDVIGKLFAKQMNFEGVSKWEELGSNIFSDTLKEVKQKIEDYHFK